jgi:hypothetical protein
MVPVERVFTMVPSRMKILILHMVDRVHCQWRIVRLYHSYLYFFVLTLLRVLFCFSTTKFDFIQFSVVVQLDQIPMVVNSLYVPGKRLG